jgi:hypothetical protein
MKQNLFRHIMLTALACAFVLGFAGAQQTAYAIPFDPCTLVTGLPASTALPAGRICPTPEPEDEAGPPAENLYDGRINNDQGHDVGAPVAIYEGSIKVYGIDPVSGDGWLDVEISQEQIDAVGVPADAPALLGQGTNHYTGIGIFVYRLPGGAFQVNTEYADGKPYIFAWDGSGGKWHFAW